MSAVRRRKTVGDLVSPVGDVEDVLSGDKNWVVALADSVTSTDPLLDRLPDSCLDSCVVDPPYELGFMGKSWDSAGISFQAETWAKVLRVLKPGGYLLSFGGTRTWHRIAVAIEDAGFEIRDEIMWMYGSGFPKSLDVSKAIDKAARGVPQGGSDPTSVNHGKYKTQRTEGKRGKGDRGQGFGAGPGQFMAEQGSGDSRGLVGDAQSWQGWGTALKPAHEPIIVARKPLIGTAANNVLKYGTGALNIDATRIGVEQRSYRARGMKNLVDQHAASDRPYVEGLPNRDEPDVVVEGRWPANVILSHHEDCEQVGSQQVRANGHHPKKRGKGAISTNGHSGQDDLVERTANGEVVEVWNCHPDCPVRLLDEQAGFVSVNAAGVFGKGKRQTGTIYANGDGLPHEGQPVFGYGDKGGPSRFFYCAKVGKKERNAGLDGFEAKKSSKMGAGLRSSVGASAEAHGLAVGTTSSEDRKAANNHPTVKPIELMRYLCRLVTQPGGVVLDFCAGSGSTGCAAVMEGFRFVGIEREPAYVRIARARISHWEQQRVG